MDHLIVRETFGFTYSAKTIRVEIIQLYQKYRKDVEKQLKVSTVTLALDGWKNAVTGNKHLSFHIMAVHNPKPYFWCSFVGVSSPENGERTGGKNLIHQRELRNIIVTIVK